MIPTDRSTRLINGQAAFHCPCGSIRIEKVTQGDPCFHSPELVFCDGLDHPAWRTVLHNLEEDSTSPRLASNICDFRAALFAYGSLLLVAGNNKAVSVDLASGAVLAEATLHQTNIASLDVLIAQEIPGGSGLVASARRIVAFDNSGIPSHEWDLPGPVTRVLSVDRETIRIKRYDVDDPMLPEIEETLAIGHA